MRVFTHLVKAGALLAPAFFVWGAFSADFASDIRAALTGRTAFEADEASKPWRQYFAEDGRTVFFGDGPPSEGRWDIRGNQYCSTWPPANDWVCYDVEFSRNNQNITWIAKDGSRTAASLYDGDVTALQSPPDQ